MVVRIRYSRLRPLASPGNPVSGPVVEWRQIALTVAALLTPCALLAFTMAFWIFASEMRWTGSFFIRTGLLSRWEIWVATAAVLLLLARLLDKISEPYPARQ